MRYLVKLKDVKAKAKYMEKELDRICENIQKLNELNDKLSWEGDAASEFYIVYDNYIKKLKEIESNVANSIAFLSLFYSRYGDEYLRLKNKFNLEDKDDKVQRRRNEII